MACCRQFTLCDPNGDPVLVVIADDGSVERFNADGTAFAGDPSTLVACGAELVDCDGNPLANPVAPLTVGQGHAPAISLAPVGCAFEPTCAPVAPACDLDGTLAFTDPGLTWQWHNGAWALVGMAPLVETVKTIAPQLAINEAGLLAINAAGTNQLQQEACVQYTNDDCVPHRISGNARFLATVQLQEGWRISTSYELESATGNPSATLTNGTPGATFDTRRNGNGFANTSYGTSFINYHYDAPLAPGDTLEICFSSRVTVRDIGDANANNFLTLQGLHNTLTAERVCS